LSTVTTDWKLVKIEKSQPYIASTAAADFNCSSFNGSYRVL